MADSSTELREQRARTQAGTVLQGSVDSLSEEGWHKGEGRDFLSRLPAQAHPQPVHTQVSFLEQPRLVCSNAGSQQWPRCNARTSVDVDGSSILFKKDISPSNKCTVL